MITRVFRDRRGVSRRLTDRQTGGRRTNGEVIVNLVAGQCRYWPDMWAGWAAHSVQISPFASNMFTHKIIVQRFKYRNIETVSCLCLYLDIFFRQPIHDRFTILYSVVRRSLFLLFTCFMKSTGTLYLPLPHIFIRLLKVFYNSILWVIIFCLAFYLFINLLISPNGRPKSESYRNLLTLTNANG
jgi:hypothetical protein